MSLRKYIHVYTTLNCCTILLVHACILYRSMYVKSFTSNNCMLQHNYVKHLSVQSVAFPAQSMTPQCTCHDNTNTCE